MTRAAVALACTLLAATGGAAHAQVPGFSVSKQFKLDRLADNHWRATGQVQMEREDQQFFADVVDFYTDTDRLEAVGNVVFVSRDGRIAADRAEFNTRTRTGVFHNAAGSASLGEHVEKSMFGTQEPDAYFYGERIEKLGPAKYRVTRGGFTTCVQPTPRWEIVATSAVITLDEYAVLTNSVLRVKGVPLLYLPIIYYPINDEDRSTGFLIPTYGNSTIRGQSLSNAFFWAISRSQDATVFHDWFSQTGQGAGGEYRYVAAPGSEGGVRTYWLKEKATTYEVPGGGTGSSPERRSYEIRASAQQLLPFGLRARGNVDYFSDVTVQQLYQQNFYDATRRQRSYGANVSGAWGANAISATYNVSEVFYGATDSTVYGSTPRVTFTRAPRRIGTLPVYTSFTSQVARTARLNRFGGVERDRGLGRVDLGPSIRVPFTRWPFLTVNSAVAWAGTYYTKSLGQGGTIVDEGLFRSYFDFRSDAVGPVLTRVWDTPGNFYATKYKHLVEPTVGVQYLTAFDQYPRIVKLEGDDFLIGGVTRLNYGLTNRFLAKRRAGGQAREFFNVALFQSYYTNPEASRYDPSYGSSFTLRPPNNFSPIVLAARGNPTDRASGSVRLEYDYQEKLLQTVRASGNVGLTSWVEVNGSWSQRRYAFDRERLDNFFRLGGSVRSPGGRVGGTYNVDYDLSRDLLVQQRLVASYSAQCCGVAVEYQVYNFSSSSSAPVPQDRRFNISFTLAGVGTFSNPFGSFGTTQGRRY